MSLCPFSGKHCQCQPDDGLPCTDIPRFVATDSPEIMQPSPIGAWVRWDDMRRLLSAAPAPSAPADQPSPDKQGQQGEWQRMKTAPRDGTNILLRWGSDGVSQGHYVPGLPKPWKFIDTNDGMTWLINFAVDNEYGPTHWMPMPKVAASPAPTEEPRTDGGNAPDRSQQG